MSAVTVKATEPQMLVQRSHIRRYSCTICPGMATFQGPGKDVTEEKRKRMVELLRFIANSNEKTQHSKAPRPVETPWANR